MHQTQYQKTVSYALIIMFVISAVTLNLGATLIAGIVSYLVVEKSSQIVKSKVASDKSHLFGLAIFTVLIILFFCGIISVIFSMLKTNTHNEGLISLINTLNSILDNLKTNYPSVAEKLPQSFEQLKNQLFVLIQEYSQELGMIGIHSVKTIIHIIIGMIIGVMIAFYRLTTDLKLTFFEKQLVTRFQYFVQSFENIIFAQIKISGINTILTGIYLLGVLPILGIHLPFAYTILLITFFAGIIPVVGNIISNSVIVCISLLVSIKVALFSLAFLVIIHKLEYFLNAKIIGDKINARPWELLTVMLLGESLFGLIGIVVAPVIYATVKKELQVAKWL